VEENERLNNAVDTLIDYFPRRRALSTKFNQEDISLIGKGFET
jgi:hypothetical protein